MDPLIQRGRLFQVFQIVLKSVLRFSWFSTAYKHHPVNRPFLTTNKMKDFHPASTKNFKVTQRRYGKRTESPRKNGAFLQVLTCQESQKVEIQMRHELQFPSYIRSPIKTNNVL